MKSYASIIGFTAVTVAIILIMAPGFATLLGGSSDAKASTYNEQNSTSTQYLTISLAGTQYSGAVTSDVTCHTVIVIDDTGRTVNYIPDYSDSVIVSAVTHPVTKIVEFDVTVAPPTGSSMPTYTLDLNVDDASNMNGTFYLSYWTTPNDDTTRHNIPFPTSPTSGVSIPGLSTGSLKICLYVNVGTGQLISQPLKPLDDVSFIFTTTVGAGS